MTTQSITEITQDSYTGTIERAQAAAAAYYAADQPVMTDAEYDAMLELIREHETISPDLAVEHELFTAVAAGTGTGDTPQPTPMPSLDKATTLDEVNSSLSRIIDMDENAARAPPLSLEPKLDGMAIRAVYRHGLLAEVVTRGNGHAGEDVTASAARTSSSQASPGMPPKAPRPSSRCAAGSS